MAVTPTNTSEASLSNKDTTSRLAYILDALLGLTSGGANGAESNIHYTAAAAANQDPFAILGAPCRITGFDIGNKAAYWCYIKLYDQAASPTSADIPVRVISIPPGGGIAKNIKQAFATKAWGRMTKLVADNDATVLVAGDLTASFDFTAS